MVYRNYFKLTMICVALTVCTIGCKSPSTDTTTGTDAATVDSTAAAPAAAMTDMSAVKAEIQALENAWAAADNARDAATLAGFYADDAVTLSNNQPMISGKANIMKDLEGHLAVLGAVGGLFRDQRCADHFVHARTRHDDLGVNFRTHLRRSSRCLTASLVSTSVSRRRMS